MKKIFLLPCARVFGVGIMLILAACGGETTENITNINQMGMEVVKSAKDLPKCTDDNEGELAFVKGEAAVRVCVDGEWEATKSDDGSSATPDFSCKTEELKDKSGLKIVCNGDSVGVVLNGAKGETGKDGEDGRMGTDCAMSERTDTSVTVTCGDSAMVIELGVIASDDSLESDSERVAISLDSLVGYTQKGPFLKGSTVYLYELSDGRTLKQTNGNFTSNIVRDDGRYKFTARDLVSQYAMVIVDGYYRNEVTGESSKAPIRLKAITDMRKHNSVNVNILTHLEFERVYHLVTHGNKDGKKLTVKAAKRQAQREILKLFHIELADDIDAEDMDVFGASEADAALLALSIMLQGKRTESELMALLSEISNAIAEKGKWEGARADTIMAQIADDVFGQNLSKIRKNVQGWGLRKDSVANFEGIIENFVARELFGRAACGEKDDDTATVRNILSEIEGKTYQCMDGLFIKKSKNTYFNDDKAITYGLMFDPRDRHVYRTIKYGEYTWMAENLNYEYKVMLHGRNKYETYGNYCNADSCEIFGRYYTWGAAMDSAAIFTENGKGCGYSSAIRSCVPSKQIRGVCPDGWLLPSTGDFFNILFENTEMQAKGFDVWPDALDGIGLSVLPTGYYDEEGRFTAATNAPFWMASESDGLSADYYDIDIGHIPGLKLGEKRWAFPIRCVKDNLVDL